MLGALTPPVKVAKANRGAWLVNVFAYTLAGMLASVAVGALLAEVGQLGDVALTSPLVAGACLLLGLVVAVREFDLLTLPLLQARRASNGGWGRRWGQPAAAILWGLDIGLFFTTWLTYAGAWWLAAVALLSGDPVFAAALFGAFWLGRALPVWLGPWLLPSPTITPWVETGLAPLRPVFRRINAAVVLLGALLLVATVTIS